MKNGDQEKKCEKKCFEKKKFFRFGLSRFREKWVSNANNPKMRLWPNSHMKSCGRMIFRAIENMCVLECYGHPPTLPPVWWTFGFRLVHKNFGLCVKSEVRNASLTKFTYEIFGSKLSGVTMKKKKWKKNSAKKKIFSRIRTSLERAEKCFLMCRSSARCEIFTKSKQVSSNKNFHRWIWSNSHFALLLPINI